MQTFLCFQYWKQKKVYTFFMEYCLCVSTTYYYSKYLSFVNHISAIYHANIKETSALRTNSKKSDRPPETHCVLYRAADAVGGPQCPQQSLRPAGRK